MANTRETSDTSMSRRGLLKAAGLGAGAAGAAAVGLAPSLGQAERPAPDIAGRAAAGYRETEHVKSYYAMARL